MYIVSVQIQQYAHQLGQQYVDMQKIVETTTHQILDQTIQPVILQLNELSPELSQADPRGIDTRRALIVWWPLVLRALT